MTPDPAEPSAEAAKSAPASSDPAHDLQPRPLDLTSPQFTPRAVLTGMALAALLSMCNIYTGLKIGWAFAWRTLIAAELVFGASSRSGGLGWFIFENRNQLETASVFAGLLTVILIGLFVESVIFRSIENATIRRWGMQS